MRAPPFNLSAPNDTHVDNATQPRESGRLERLEDSVSSLRTSISEHTFRDDVWRRLYTLQRDNEHLHQENQTSYDERVALSGALSASRNENSLLLEQMKTTKEENAELEAWLKDANIKALDAHQTIQEERRRLALVNEAVTTLRAELELCSDEAKKEEAQLCSQLDDAYQLSAQLRCENAVLTDSVAEANGQLQEARHDREMLRMELEASQKTRSALERQTDQLRASKGSLALELKSVEEQLAKAREVVAKQKKLIEEDLATELRIADEAKAQLSAEVAALSDQLKGANEALKSSDAQLLKCRETVAKQRRVIIEEHPAELRAAHDKSAQLKARLSQSEQTIAQEREKCAQAEREKTMLTGARNIATLQASDLRAFLKQAREVTAQLKFDGAKVSAELMGAKQCIREEREKTQRVEDEKAVLRQNYATANQKILDMDKSIAAVKRDRDQFQAFFIAARKEKENVQQELDNITRAMRETKLLGQYKEGKLESEVKTLKDDLEYAVQRKDEERARRRAADVENLKLASELKAAKAGIVSLEKTLRHMSI